MVNQIKNNKTTVLHRFSWCDPIIIFALLAGIFITIPALKSLTPGKVTVFRDNQIIAEYPIDQTIIFDVKGKEGLMKVEIINHSVTVRTSSCQHQLCVRQGSISKTHNQIVCIPNHILITINAQKDNRLDAIAH